MITFTNKGRGCTDKILAAGHSFAQRGGEWVSSDDAAVQVIIDGYTLDECKAYHKTLVEAVAKEKRDAIVADKSPGEMASWTEKLRQARNFTTEPADEADAAAKDVHALWAEAQARGATTESIKDRVLANASALLAVEAAIAGAGGAHKDAIDALATFEAVVTYDYTTGWP